MPNPISAEQFARDLALRDLTDPNAGPHAVQALATRAATSLTGAWRCAEQWHRGSRVVSVVDNYDNLGFTADAASRDERYTRYVDRVHMLRSHTSATIPGALRALAAAPVDDVLLVCPGIVYRRDAIDRLHSGAPHQLDLWRISRGRLGEDALQQMLAVLADALAPGLPWRAERRMHPYTEGGLQVDVAYGGEWIEVWECGRAHPRVMERAGLAGWDGLALGLGLDRWLMITKGIPDIRLLRSEEPRIAGQMLDLAPYRAVSAQPAVVRDLSVAVDGADTVEDLGDRVRNALGARAAEVEEVSVVTETPFEDLPQSAAERMGMRPSQKNVLVRVVLRSVERTLTDAEANVLRDRVYAALHQGHRKEWATGTIRAPEG